MTKETRIVHLPDILEDLPNDGIARYMLRSIIAHEGVAGKGHYIAMVKCPWSGHWIVGDDSMTTHNPAYVQRHLNNAYMVFYERIHF